MSIARKHPPYTVLRRVETLLVQRHDAGLGPITRKDAAASLGLPLRVFEMAVEGLRNVMTPVCSGSTGYYWSDHPGDISATVGYLSRIAISHSRTLRSMRRVLQAAQAKNHPRQKTFLEAPDGGQTQSADEAGHDVTAVPDQAGAHNRQHDGASLQAAAPAGDTAAVGVPGLPEREQNVPHSGSGVGMRDVREGVPGFEAV